jgi:hypothetical protein
LVRACGTAHIRFGDHRVDIRTDHRILLGAIGLIGADAADQVSCPAFLAIGGARIAFVPSSPPGRWSPTSHWPFCRTGDARRRVRHLAAIAQN